jgi:alpha-tubulin suppressor-like RCC1 family protein
LGNAPTGVTGAFNPAAPTGTSSTLTVSVGAAVAPGTYNLTVDGTGTPGNRSTPLTLTVSAAPDYTLSLAPAALTITQGANAPTTVTITRTNFTGAVTLNLGGAPTGVTGSFNPAAPTGTSSTLTVSVGAAVAPGVYNLTVDGSGTAGSRSTPLTLTVSPTSDYSLSLAPAALTIVKGENGSSTVTIARTNFTGAVTLGLTGAPTGVTGAFTPAAPTGTSATLTVNVSYLATPGVYNLTVTGTGSAGNRSTPLTVTVSPSGISDIASVDAGDNHSCALRASGVAYCWGDNSFGQLGDGTTTNRLVPTPVAGSLTFISLSAGGDYTCGVATGGAGYCWGYNGDGRLGDNTATQRLVPTAVVGGLTFASVITGDFHSCALTSSGAAYCWGAGSYIGDGTTTQRLAPTAVAGGLTFASINASAGPANTNVAYTCGVTPSGAAYCWGYNTFGALGDGTTTQRLVPNAVTGGLTFAAVRAGGYHTCSVTTSGAAYCWGANGNGQLGDGTTTQRLVPMPVAFPTPQ